MTIAKKNAYAFKAYDTYVMGWLSNLTTLTDIMSFW